MFDKAWKYKTLVLKILAIQAISVIVPFSSISVKAIEPEQIIRGWGGKCLDIVNNQGKGPRNGTPVVIWDCYGAENQRWQVNSDGTIRGWGGKCLDVVNNQNKGPQSGTPIVIWDCRGTANQKWKVNSNGTITGWGSKCLDVINNQNKGPQSGTGVVIWSCRGTENQKWQVNSFTSQCIGGRVQRDIQQLSKKSREDEMEAVFYELVKCNSKAVPELIKAIANQDKDVRIIAIAALGSIGSDASPAIPALIKAFQDSDVDVRIAAADALGDISSHAQSAYPLLMKTVLQDRNEDVRLIAALAAVRISEQKTVPQLIQSLKSPSSEVRNRAAEALGNIGYPANSAVSLLENMAIQDKDINVRSTAKLALQKIWADQPKIELNAVNYEVAQASLSIARKKPWICRYINKLIICKG
jgi:HEAT repeats/HEAT repeat